MGDDKSKIKVSDLLVKALENEGVEYVVGIPGEENLDVLESLRKSKIKVILTRHEQAAGFICATVGRLTGQVKAVALSTLGPGATNFTTAAAFAHLGGMPCVFLTGQKGIRSTKQAEFQIVDIVSMYQPLTKYAKTITDGNLVPSMVRRAFREATTEKPGPTLLELPEDIASMQTEFNLFEPTPVRRPVTDEKGTHGAVDILRNAKRPIMIVGAAANRHRARRAIREFVDELKIHVVSTQMGKGVVDERSEFFLGCAAISSKDYIHAALDISDVIIMVGHDTTEKPPFIMSSGASSRKVIHISFDPAHVDSTYFPQVEIVGDCANAVWQIKEKLRADNKVFDAAPFRRIKEYTDECMQPGTDDDQFPMNVARVITDMRKVLPDDAILSLDNGLYKVMVARYYKAVEPLTVLLDNALATMGAGLPNAIGTNLVSPDQPVVAICGDGGYLMNSEELATAVQYGFNITVLVLNDNALGMIKWKQEGMNFDEYNLDLRNPDFVKHAEAFGAQGHRVSKTEEFADVLRHCIGTKGVHVVEVPVTYRWVSDMLEKVPSEASEILRRIVDEFGEDILLGDSLPPSSKEEADEASKEASEECTKRLDKVRRSNSERSSTSETKGCEESQQEKSASSSSATKSSSESKSKSASTSEKSENKSTSQSDSKESEKWSINKGDSVPFYLVGRPVYANEDLEVMDKHTNEVFCKVAVATKSDMETAIHEVSTTGARKMAALPHYVRKEILMNVAREARRRSEELAMMTTIENGKAISDARGEVERLVQTFEIAAEETVRMYGEAGDMDIAKRAHGYQGIVKRFPRGPVSMISPFNFPLNLLASKVAPAIAAGCPFVVKPASRTPLGSLLVGEILANDPNMPKEGFSVLPCTRESGDALTTDDRFKLLSFTGSASVGWELKAKASKKHVVLELGGNAACVVDDLDEGLDTVVQSITTGAFYQSGQSCISVQRLFVHESIYSRFKDAFVEKVKSLKMGDPKEEDTFLGPVISEKDADRITEWIKEATDKGANLLTGGNKQGTNFVEATVLENVSHDCTIYNEELFGPAVCLEPYSDFASIVDEVNNSRYGLQAGVFTNNLSKAHYAFENMHCGGVVINNVPSYRIDSQPYGGVKDSGLGREGVRYAIEDMTEMRIMLMKEPGKLRDTKQ
ncbi:Aldehyde dehydrogenase [Hondaea fermentalgiana]|uniref:NADP-dependent glyceraldehyde-3-phosphate dehydrogenase n=1 Tax=Hondaea fermentalgiana TaxID=2315210 RepID=A0A2R5G899_9STRA|nr:Aldehyde dehydrogenase [Hondaea fermentalgiana]|eukprot:GBG27282.1 Aldehyde dehydrogenase [Hondaea fermentalgiana]